MANINFVPDDYIQKKDSWRANWMYLVLCLLLIGALGGSFVIIKVKEKSVQRQAAMVAQKLAQAQKEIEQFERLQAKRKKMMKTALTAVELIEPVPRSLILANLTNELPKGTSLVRIKLTEKDRSRTRARKVKGRGANGSTGVADNFAFLEIEGIAPTDKEVAEYIAQLGNSVFFQRVDLAFTKEYVQDRGSSIVQRKFKLNTIIKADIELTKKDIESIRYTL